MNLFTYTDHKTETIIFTYTCESILEADAAYKSKFGVDVSKQMYVGCSIKFYIPSDNG